MLLQPVFRHECCVRSTSSKCAGYTVCERQTDKSSLVENNTTQNKREWLNSFPFNKYSEATWKLIANSTSRITSKKKSIRWTSASYYVSYEIVRHAYLVVNVCAKHRDCLKKQFGNRFPNRPFSDSGWLSMAHFKVSKYKRLVFWSRQSSFQSPLNKVLLLVRYLL